MTNIVYYTGEAAVVLTVSEEVLADIDAGIEVGDIPVPLNEDDY